MEKLIPTRIGKHRQGTQEEADKQGYRFFMHSESKRPKKGSPENTNSKTPTTNRHTSKERSTKMAVVKRFGKILPISQAQGRNEQVYPLFTHNKSKDSKASSPESTDSKTRTKDRSK